jgi:hypothetical protein
VPLAQRRGVHGRGAQLVQDVQALLRVPISGEKASA